MPVTGTLAVGVAAGLDLAVEEFPRRVHPVALFGRLLRPLDHEWSHPRATGAVGVISLATIAAGVVGIGVELAGRVDPLLAAVVAGLVLFSTTSLRMLLRIARQVVRESESDLASARERLPSLVGRDPANLSPGQVRSAAVESAAENLADGLVAPLLAFALCAPLSLPLAAGATAWLKAVNTADAMLGYHSKPVGLAAARLDDAVMWAPARLSAVLLALAAGDPGALRRALPFVREPESPNSGWPMATLAAALNVRLEKPGAYVLRPDADLPTVSEATRGVRIAWIAGGLAVLLAGVIAWV